jgi:hypothetical protein
MSLTSDCEVGKVNLTQRALECRSRVVRRQEYLKRQQGNFLVAYGTCQPASFVWVSIGGDAQMADTKTAMDLASWSGATTSSTGRSHHLVASGLRVRLFPAPRHSLVEEVKTSLPMVNLLVRGGRDDLKRESAWW